jgi:hypothetical protein
LLILFAHFGAALSVFQSVESPPGHGISGIAVPLSGARKSGHSAHERGISIVLSMPAAMPPAARYSAHVSTALADRGHPCSASRRPTEVDAPLRVPEPSVRVIEGNATCSDDVSVHPGVRLLSGVTAPHPPADRRPAVSSQFRAARSGGACADRAGSRFDRHRTIRAVRWGSRELYSRGGMVANRTATGVRPTWLRRDKTEWEARFGHAEGSR